MEQIISKAIEGGYKYDKRNGMPITHYDDCESILDPFFWQALGKACGWTKWDMIKKEEIQNGWKDKALRFYEINLTEGWDAGIKYLEDLIKENE